MEEKEAQARKSVPRKKTATAYMVKGLTAQLTKSVSPTGRALRPDRSTSPKLWLAGAVTFGEASVVGQSKATTGFANRRSM